MELYLIRHGQSKNNELDNASDGDTLRNPDPPLTKTGHLQARKVGGHLAKPKQPYDPSENEQFWGWDHYNHLGYGLTHIYASLLTRALQTAAEIGHATGLKPVLWHRIHEVGGITTYFPEMDARVPRPGLSRKEILTTYPGAVLDPETEGHLAELEAAHGPDTGWWNHAPQESPEQARMRARKWVASLKERHAATNHRVAVVSHCWFIVLVLAELCGIPDIESLWFSTNNCGITRVDLVPGSTRIVYQNRLDHLEHPIITT
ncbi:histidine phosphatase family protein [Spirochaeta lutea]|uniref:Phosphoglycerate mutase n=1 Tax=Spirochaeta lutea TaxID=1480694 RepID=A0A098QY05_9SPIO|nr:histidine phosphatase family protein [Spirochaeta lutea]KGE72426.1 hypothetical protein DC28_07135 [Spirochaeta lutea]